MFLLTVAPIQRGIPVSELSYVVKTAPPVGALVLVPVRKKDIPALVLSVTDVREAKAAIKDADFALRKIDTLTILDTFSPAFIAAAEEIANWSVATLGATIQALFPTILLDEKSSGVSVHSDEHTSDATHAIVPPLPTVLQAEEAERIATYKSHIREVFARNGSVFFILPTVQDIERTDAAIGKGIGTYTYVLHGNLTKKQLRERLLAIKESTHPLLVIATPQFLAVPCGNLQSIILERESASAYTMTHRPFIDLRRFVEAYARERRLPLIIGDLFLRVETLARFERGELDASSRPKGRYSSVARTHIVDMRESGEQPSAGRVAFFSRELVSLIKDTRKRSATTFILCIRRGVAPMTVCGDCGTVVECDHCKAPLVLHHKTSKQKEVVTDIPVPTETLPGDATTEELSAAPLPPSEPAPVDLTSDESAALGTTLPHPNFPEKTETKNAQATENIFICHRCGDKSAPKHKCAHCGGWRLTPLGLGIAQAEEILRSRFPDAPIFRLDTDAVTTHKQARERAEEFLHTPGAILLGTEMALPYLTDPIGLVSVLSVNSLLTIPEFRMTEHVFRLLLVLREKARDHFLIQTREANPLFPLAAEGNIGEFLRSELELRKELGFPPYTTLIKVSHLGDRHEGLEFVANLNAQLGDLGINNVVLPNYVTKQGNKVSLHSLIVMRREAWPHPALRTYLATLPPSVSIRVDPKSIVNE